MTYHVVVNADVWTVLTAIGTVGAVVVALDLAFWASRAEKRLRRDTADREAQAEARKVVTQFVRRPEVIEDLEFWRDYIEIINAGDEPIFNARMVYGRSNKGSPSMQDWTWMHGNGRESSYTPLLLAQSVFRFSGNWQTTSEPMSIDPSEADRGGFYAIVSWTDARNRHWMRRGTDQPVELRQTLLYGESPVPLNRHGLASDSVREAKNIASEIAAATAGLGSN